jgi:hypothetical protein
VGAGPTEEDGFDEEALLAAEATSHLLFGELQVHRDNPLFHIMNMDLSCYVREYAPADERAEMRARHVAAWPDAVDAALEALDRVRAPVAQGLLPSAEGLAVDIDADDPASAAPLRALERFIEHLKYIAVHGDPNPAIGAGTLARMMGTPEAMTVDVGALSATADSERARLTALLLEACERLRPGSSANARQLIKELGRDHPQPEGIYAEARSQIEEITRFTLEHDLIPDPGGECLVGPSPPSLSWAMAMMAWSAPFEADAPSWYWVTPPNPSWPEDEQEEWLTVFSSTALPAITAHEVTPGHFAHGRMLRRLTSDVRRALQSLAFAEGWAHYTEELLVEEGFRAGDPRFVIGVCLEALIRVTRLAVALGLHSGALSLDECVARFEQDAFLERAAAKSEALRATFNPTYGYYTWGKLEVLQLREQARAAWGTAYSHRRFHESLLALGSPPLGLLAHALH